MSTDVTRRKFLLGGAAAVATAAVAPPVDPLVFVDREVIVHTKPLYYAFSEQSMWWDISHVYSDDLGNILKKRIYPCEFFKDTRTVDDRVKVAQELLDGQPYQGERYKGEIGVVEGMRFIEDVVDHSVFPRRARSTAELGRYPPGFPTGRRVGRQG